MGIITKARSQGQKCVWWEQDDKDEYGNETFKAPIEIDCRWDDKTTKVITTDGDEKVSTASVMVDRMMKPGDKLKRATLEELIDQDAEDNDDTYQIIMFERIPNFRNTEILYMAMV